jgi:hypothetical protein
MDRATCRGGDRLEMVLQQRIRDAESRTAKLGIIKEPLNWLSDPALAMGATAVLQIWGLFLRHADGFGGAPINRR